MNKQSHNWKVYLSGLFVIQLTLAVGLLWHDQLQQQQNGQQALFAFDQQQLDRVIIKDSEDKQVLITKTNEAWQLPELQQLPASDTKLGSLLSKLENLNVAWPVATTSSSHQRFEVSNDTFQRRIELYQGESLLAELLIGTSPGFRKTHIRKAGEDEVYTAKLNTYDLPLDNNSWLDKSLLSAGSITKISGPDYALTKKDDNWAFEQAPIVGISSSDKTNQVNTDKAKELAAALSHLNIQGIADKEINTEQSDLSLQVSSSKGNWTYQFIKQDNAYYVTRNDHETVFKISQYDFDRVSQIDRSQLALNTVNEQGDNQNETQQSNS